MPPYTTQPDDPLKAAFEARLGAAEKQLGAGVPMARSIASAIRPAAPPAEAFGAGYSAPGKASVPKQAIEEIGAVSVPYGGKTRFETFHKGLDLAAPIGKPLPSFTGGKVVEVVKGLKQGDKGYGNYVTVQDAYGNKYRYSHLNDSWVNVGDEVKKGQRIGSVGNTGSTYSVSGGSGAHLDFRVVNAYGKYVDPTATIRAYYGV